jgi:hypothetical protein
MEKSIYVTHYPLPIYFNENKWARSANNFVVAALKRREAQRRIILCRLCCISFVGQTMRKLVSGCQTVGSILGSMGHKIQCVKWLLDVNYSYY